MNETSDQIGARVRVFWYRKKVQGFFFRSFVITMRERKFMKKANVITVCLAVSGNKAGVSDLGIGFFQ